MQEPRAVLERPKLAALAVVLHQDHVLLVQRRNAPDAGLWGFPGGHVERGETALSAAARELAEETGVSATPLDYLGNLDIIQPGEAGDIQHHYFLAAVLCRYVAGQPLAADDALAAEWVSFDEVFAARRAMSADVARLLQLAIARDVG